MAYVNGMDFNGDGTTEDLLPGSKVNQFSRGLGKDHLMALVQRYNLEFANKRTSGGQTAPSLTLPSNYSFNDGFFTQDLRLSRTFSLGSERVRLTVFGEVFNLLNVANLAGYGRNIANPIAMILSVKEGLSWLGDRKQDAALHRAAAAIEDAVVEVLEAGAPLTYDIVGEAKAAKCSEVGTEIARRAAARLR